ncbi:MAG: hypothetical protein ACOVK9_09410 [Bacteroidia bacterium]
MSQYQIYENIKTLKHFTILILLATTTLMACKKEETKAKDGELTVVVQPTLPDANVIEGIFIKVYDPSDWTLLQEKEFWVKKGEFKFTNLPKKNIYVVARMEYIIATPTGALQKTLILLNTMVLEKRLP